MIEAAGNPPPESAPRREGCWLSGRDPLLLRRDAGFVRIGERTNVAGSARFARLIRDRRYADAVTVAREQVARGARMLDVNMDHADVDGPIAMQEFLAHLAADPEESINH